MTSASKQSSPSTKRDFPGKRWFSIVLRSFHLVGVVLAGAAIVAATPLQSVAVGTLLVTGLGLYAIDLWSQPSHWRELAGMFIPLKLSLVAAMVMLPGYAAQIFWILVVASSVTSHAPAAFRHRRLLG